MKNLYHIILFIIGCFYIIIIGLNITSSKYNFIEGFPNNNPSSNFLTYTIPVTLKTPEDVSVFIDRGNYQMLYEKTDDEEFFGVDSDKTDEDYSYIDWGDKPNCYEIPCSKGGRACLYDQNMKESEKEKFLNKSWACPKLAGSYTPKSKPGTLTEKSKKFPNSEIKSFLNKLKSII